MVNTDVTPVVLKVLAFEAIARDCGQSEDGGPGLV
jgi:hypothetical protein